VIEAPCGLPFRRDNRPQKHDSTTRRIAAGFALVLLLPMVCLANAVPAYAETRFVSAVEDGHFVYLPPQPAQRILLVAHRTPRKSCLVIETRRFRFGPT